MYKGERLNSYTHLIGAIGAFFGLIVLLFLAVQSGDIWRFISFTVYGFSLITLYLCSTLYHSFQGKWKDFFRKMDHIAIYLLIAGTYTPFALVSIRGEIGLVILGIVWSLAFIGITLDIFRTTKSSKRIFQLIIYLAMGWLVIFAIEPLIESIPSAGFYWLITGGLFYTSGVLFYIMSNWHRFAHGIWHLFVLAGSLSHFISIIAYV